MTKQVKTELDCESILLTAVLSLHASLLRKEPIMSVSTISNANALGSVQQRRNTSAAASSTHASSFASVLNNARQIDNNNTGLNAVVSNNSTSEFSSILSQAQNSNATTTNVAAGVNSANNFGLADLYLYNSLQAAQGLSQVNDVNAVSANSVVGLGSADQDIGLENLTLDFTALLPQGSKDFMQNLKCSADEKNNLVNLMVFGTENGPQGQNAAEYFGKSSMSADELASSLQEVLGGARINTWEVTGNDYGFVLSNQGSPVGQTLAAEQGLSLEQRAIERDLDSTYEKDMALMQILSRTNNQSANIF